MGDLYMLLCMWSWDKAATLLPTLTDEQVHTNLSLKSELDDSSSLHTAICAMPLDLFASLLEKSSLVNKKCVLAIMSDGCDCYTALHCFCAEGGDAYSGRDDDLAVVKLLVRVQPAVLKNITEPGGMNAHEIAQYRGKFSAEAIALLKACTEAIDAGYGPASRSW